MRVRNVSNLVFGVTEELNTIYAYGKDLPFWDAEYFRRDKRLKSLLVWDDGLRTATRAFQLNSKQTEKGAKVVKRISLLQKEMFEHFIQNQAAAGG